MPNLSSGGCKSPVWPPENLQQAMREKETRSQQRGAWRNHYSAIGTATALGTAVQADSNTNGWKFLKHLLESLSCQGVLVSLADLVGPRKTETKPGISGGSITGRCSWQCFTVREPQHNHLEKTWGEGPITAPQPKLPFNYYYTGIKNHAQKHLQEHVFPWSGDRASPSLCCSLHSQDHSCAWLFPSPGSVLCHRGNTIVSQLWVSLLCVSTWQGKHTVCSHLHQLDTCSSWYCRLLHEL